jgi:hypothetical protein
MISFTKVPIVEEGERATSAQYNKLAAAFNDRLRLNLGDTCWRVCFKIYSLAREFFGSGEAMENQEDFWLAWMMNIKETEALPALADLNAANPVVRFCFGVAGGIAAEWARLNNLVTWPAGDLEAVWELGKDQRGARDPDTGDEGSPARDAARCYDPWAEHADGVKWLMTFGGWLGRPKTDPECESPNCFEVLRTFRQLCSPFAVETYSQCHPACQGGSYSNLQTVDYYHDRYVLTFYDQTTLEKPYAEWLEGPYLTNAALARRRTDSLGEMIYGWDGSFRGSDEQRAVDAGYRIKGIAFDTERFYKSQYALAPSIGHVEEEELVADYPAFARTGPASEGAKLFYGGGTETEYQFHEEFVLAGFYATSTSSGPTSLIFRDLTAQEDFYELTLPAGGERLVWFETCRRPNLEIRLGAALADGLVTVECAELQEYRPDRWDGYVVLRRGTTMGDAEALDPVGWLYSGARALSDAYFEHGCIVNEHELPEPLIEGDVQKQPIYQTIRRAIQERLRLMKRQLFSSYEEVDGQAVIHFLRGFEVTIGGQEFWVDPWEGLAPPLEAIASGELLDGVEYRVQGTSGSVTYDGTEYEIGQEFTAAVGVRDYEATGDAAPHQINGIIATAPAAGRSNEWLMFMGLNTPWTDGGDLNEENYGDPLTALVARAHVASSEFDAMVNQDLWHQISPGEDPPIRPVGPSGLNYTHGCNAATAPEFYKSNPIYPEAYTVERVENEEGGLVKVTLAGPLQKDETLVDDYRTDDNALRTYQSEEEKEREDCGAPITGDFALYPFDYPAKGSCHPRFWFLKMVPKARVDTPEDNDSLQLTDTRRFADDFGWMNFLLEAMCEGFVNRDAMRESPCQGLIHYSMESLCYQQLGNRWSPIMPLRKRPQNDQGHGPMSNMRVWLEHFNDLAWIFA